MIILFPIHSYVNLPKGIEYNNIILSDKDMFEECIARGNATVVVVTGTAILVPSHYANSLKLIWR